MSLTESRRGWRLLRHGEPGRRFRAFHDWRVERRGLGWPPSRILTVIAGGLLVLAGLAVGWLPGPGGFVAIVGAGLLATEWRLLAKLLDGSELRVRRLWRRLRG